MKIVNFYTKKVFDLPKSEANKLLEDFPEEFGKYSKSMNKKIEKPLISNNQNTVLSKILDE
jgi:hypothetical protein